MLAGETAAWSAGAAATALMLAGERTAWSAGAAATFKDGLNDNGLSDGETNGNGR